MGFFLPVPPVGGGATEKIWLRLAQEFALRGHDVTIISRQWPGWPSHERRDGVSHLRLPGFTHRARLWQNLLLDAVWSQRVWRALPRADVTILHVVALPLLLRVNRRHAGKIAVVPGRMPKGQYRWYGNLDRVFATSGAVREQVLVENPALADATLVRGNPIDWTTLSAGAPRQPAAIPVIGFVGRMHREKGLDLFADAIDLLVRDTIVPPFEIILCGPTDVARGGSGPEYLAHIKRRLETAAGRARVTIVPFIQDAHELATLYRKIDIFCYPSVAESGETFGVAVAEAMAAGAVPVVSNLKCFRDFVVESENALSFDHSGPDAAANLAAVLRRLLESPALRTQLAARARADVQRYDYPRFAETLLEDFRVMQTEQSS